MRSVLGLLLNQEKRYMQTDRQLPATILESKIAAAPNAVSLSIDEFAKTFGICRRSVYNLLKDGKLKSFTVASRRRIPASEVQRIVSEAA